MKTQKKILAIMSLGALLFACSQQNEAYTEELSMKELKVDDAESALAQNTTEGYYATNTEQEFNKKDATTSLEEFDAVSNQNEGTLVNTGSASYSVTSTTNANTYNWTANGETQKSKDNQSIISSKALSNPYKDKKFIKTADLEFMVKEVYHSTVAIENIVLANNGFIINSNLFAEVVRTETFEKNENWSVKVQEFSTQNHITLRVPSSNLHETLLKIADQIEFLDYRSITADDVGLKLLAEELEQKRNAKSAQNIQNQIQAGGKLDDRIYAEQLAFEKETQKDISKLKELSIEDKIEYSTITISIYQETELLVKDVANFDGIKNQYKKPFHKEIMSSILIGLNMVWVVLNGLICIWPLLLLAGLIFIVIRKKLKKD